MKGTPGCWRVCRSYIAKMITQCERVDMATDSRWIEMGFRCWAKGDPLSFSTPGEIACPHCERGLQLLAALEGWPGYGAAFLQIPSPCSESSIICCSARLDWARAQLKWAAGTRGDWDSGMVSGGGSAAVFWVSLGAVVANC